LWKQCTETKDFSLILLPAVYMYFYTTQQNRHLRVNASLL
jgi:hypothetical protein